METVVTIEQKGQEQAGQQDQPKKLVEQPKQTEVAKPQEQKTSKKAEKVIVPKAVIEQQKSFDAKIDEDEGAEPKAKKSESEEESAPDKKTKTKQGDEEPATEVKVDEQPDKEKPAEQKAKPSPELLTRAAKAGLTLSQAMAFSSPEDLEGALAIFEASTRKADDKPAGADGKKGEEELPEKFDCGLNPDEYDEGLIKSMNAMGQKMLDKINALTTELKAKGGSGTSNDAAIAAHTSWLDSKFAGLGAESEDLFGKGNVGEIEPGSEAYKNRAAVDREVLAIATGYKQTGQQMPPKDKIFERAVNNLFGEKIKQAKETVTKGKLQKRAGQAIGPGSNAVDAKENKALKVQKDFDAKLDDEG